MNDEASGPSLAGTGIWEMALRYGDSARAADSAAEIEALGYTAVWIPDTGGDLFGAMANLLGSTRSLTVASGILNIWMQDAADSARRYHQLVTDHGSRVLVGLGVSHAPLIDRVLDPGMFRKPLAKIAAYLDAMDTAAPALPVEDRILAALGTKMLELARDRTAGAHPYLVSDETAISARVKEHRDAGADHVCVQVLTDRDDLETVPLEQWRRLAAALV